MASGTPEKRAVTRAEWRSILGMGGFILLLHVIGWGILAGLVSSSLLPLGSSQVFKLGLGVTAYTALQDADNTTGY